ncbi:hypothetical protein AKJ65_03605 [candidate division MSBL1 archaeon SCGC-AAA259E19]|uniref:Uncharacterized protein n=1 Tax=candidate division MSBL1 archaeon SCGC-AAA259E19 TaxID=1698264 RepID=A0A133UKM5_9EURY|nr:hypothetical protein AKJ65_03605 [candidate division MSBL1 archaeon SCGC-AAA259E19]
MADGQEGPGLLGAERQTIHTEQSTINGKRRAVNGGGGQTGLTGFWDLGGNHHLKAVSGRSSMEMANIGGEKRGGNETDNPLL